MDTERVTSCNLHVLENAVLLLTSYQTLKRGRNCSQFTGHTKTGGRPDVAGERKAADP